MRSNFTSRTFATVVTLAAAVPTATTAAPVQVPYTGTLSINADGAGAADIAVRIYDASSNGNQVWPPAAATAVYTGVPLRAGRFSITLGDTTGGNSGLDTNVFADPARTLWLEVEVGRAGAERVRLSPRQRLLAVPIAAEVLGGAALRSILSWHIDGRLAGGGGTDLQADGIFGSADRPEEIRSRLTWTAHATSQAAHTVCLGGGAQPNGCGNTPESIALGFAGPPSARAVEACFEFGLQTNSQNCGELNLTLAKTNPVDSQVVERGTTHTFYNINGAILGTVHFCDTFATTPGAETVIRLMRWQRFNGCGAASIEPSLGIRVSVRPLM